MSEDPYTRNEHLNQAVLTRSAVALLDAFRRLSARCGGHMILVEPLRGLSRVRSHSGLDVIEAR